jgi:hypothetical protein
VANRRYDARMRRAAALLLAVLLLAGCHASPVFDGPARVERSRYYAIRTDVATATSFAILDVAVERVSARLGVAPPPAGALEAVVFESSDSFHAFREAHRAQGGAGAVGFYCPRGKEIAVSSIAISAAELSRDLDRFGEEMERRARDAREAPFGPVARELSELARELAEKHRRLAPIFQAEDLQTIVHEVVHQLMDREGLLEGRPWLVEGLAELESTTALSAHEVPDPIQPVWELLCSRRHEVAVVVLAARAACGKRVFDASGSPTWEDAIYAAHLALVTWLEENAPGTCLRLARGGESLDARLVVRIEREAPRWARLRATDRLAGRERPEACELLELLWSAPGRDIGALAADERARLAKGLPPARALDGASRERLQAALAALYPLEGDRLLEDAAR